MLYVSATPGERELLHLCEVTGQDAPIGLRHVSGGGGVEEPEYSKKHPDSESMYDMLQMIEHIPRMEIRPTGLLDPSIEVRGTEGQVADLLSEINARIERGERTTSDRSDNQVCRRSSTLPQQDGNQSAPSPLRDRYNREN